MSPVISRTSLRAGAVCAGVALCTLAASPALAYEHQTGDDPGPGLTALQTIGLYVVIPVLVFAIIALLVYAPSLAKGPKYRPDLSWGAQPIWFNSPVEGGTQLDSNAAPLTAATTRGGGASARW